MSHISGGRALFSVMLALALGTAPDAEAAKKKPAAPADTAQTTESQSHGGKASKNDQMTLQVCNRTTNKLMIGVSYVPTGASDWRNKGWTPVEAGACQNLFVTENKTFYARAEVSGDADQYWGSDIKQCVQYPGPYDFTTTSDSTSCPDGDDVADFTTFHSDGRLVYTWNLDP